MSRRQMAYRGLVRCSSRQGCRRRPQTLRGRSLDGRDRGEGPGCHQGDPPVAKGGGPVPPLDAGGRRLVSPRQAEADHRPRDESVLFGEAADGEGPRCGLLLGGDSICISLWIILAGRLAHPTPRTFPSAGNELLRVHPPCEMSRELQHVTVDGESNSRAPMTLRPVSGLLPGLQSLPSRAGGCTSRLFFVSPNPY